MSIVRLIAIAMFWLGVSICMADSLPPLPYGTTVRVQSNELLPGWHVGKLETTREGCYMVWISSSEVPGGRNGLGLVLLSKLERQDGSAWLDVPIKPLMAKEPKHCQDGAG